MSKRILSFPGNYSIVSRLATNTNTTKNKAETTSLDIWHLQFSAFEILLNTKKGITPPPTPHKAGTMSKDIKHLQFSALEVKTEIVDGGIVQRQQ